MSATGPLENNLSDWAELLVVVAGAEAEEEPDDELGLEEVMVVTRERVEVLEETVGSGVGSGIDELLETTEDVPEAGVLEAVPPEVVEEDGGSMGPGPKVLVVAEEVVDEPETVIDDGPCWMGPGP